MAVERVRRHLGHWGASSQAAEERLCRQDRVPACRICASLARGSDLGTGLPFALASFPVPAADDHLTSLVCM